MYALHVSLVDKFSPWHTLGTGFYFNVYFRDCPVVKPCKLQQGTLWEVIKVKYDILLRALLASGRYWYACVCACFMYTRFL